MNQKIRIMPCLDMRAGRVVKGVQFVDILEAVEAGATILLAASVFHFCLIEIPRLKNFLRERGVNVS